MKYEKGNALFLILIAVALFAALSYAITNSGRGGSGIDKEKVSLELSQVAQYAASLQTATQRMMLIGGCDESELSFENNVATYYTNASAPDECKYFDPAGAGIAHPTTPPPEIWKNSGTGFHRENYTYMSGISITDIGTAENELFVFLNIKDADTCREINDKFNGSSTIPTAAFCGGPFTGSFASVGGCTDTEWVNATGWPSGCIERSAVPGDYFYFNVLLPR